MTPRLVLRSPSERDIPAWFARATDVESASLAGDPIPDDISAGARWFARSRQRFADGKAIKWSIDQVGISDAIGTITLSFSGTDAKAAALGFVLARAHWGQGLGSEAAREVLRYGFALLLCLVSVPLHLSTFFSWSTEYLNTFPFWYNAVEVPMFAALAYAMMRLRFG